MNDNDEHFEHFNAAAYVPADAKHPDIAARLIEALVDAGHIAPRAASYADAKALAQMAGVEYDVARRYLRGHTRPPSPRVARIAERLRVNPAWLDHGQGPKRPAPPGTAPFDSDLLEKCVDAVEAANDELNAALTRHEKAKLIAYLYRQYAGAPAQGPQREETFGLLELMRASPR